MQKQRRAGKTILSGWFPLEGLTSGRAVGPWINRRHGIFPDDLDICKIPRPNSLIHFPLTCFARAFWIAGDIDESRRPDVPRSHQSGKSGKTVILIAGASIFLSIIR
jgi:hypothetical protein